MTHQHEERLADAGWTLPTIRPPSFNYAPSIAINDLVFFSGKTPPPDFSHRGRLGAEINIETGRNAAVAAALHCLAQIDADFGLASVKQIVKLTGYVASTGDFADQPQVVDAASDVFTRVLGDKGKHTRSAIGVASLPGGWPVELEITIQLTEDR